MMEMMSHEAGPTRLEACFILYRELYEYNSQINKNYLRDVIYKEVYKYDEEGLGSAAGWMVYMKDNLTNLLKNKIKQFINIKKRFQVTVRCIGKWMLLYHHILEKRYAPGGVFETEAIKYWNPLLWELSPRDTVKYIAYINNNK